MSQRVSRDGRRTGAGAGTGAAEVVMLSPRTTRAALTTMVNVFITGEVRDGCG